MRFYSTGKAPVRSTDLVCGQPWLGALVVVVTLAGASGGFLYLGYRADSFFLMVIGGAMLPFALLFALHLRAALKPGNWLLRYDGQRLLVRFRSYANWRLSADDVVVLELEPDDVVNVRTLLITREKRIGKRRHIERHPMLEISVRGDLGELQQLLDAEYMRRKATRGIGSLQPREYPMHVLDEQTLRVDFTGAKPKLKKVLPRLAESYEVVEEA